MRIATNSIQFASVYLVCAIAAGSALAGDWPMWGHDPSRNMVSAEKGLPISADPGKAKDDGSPVDMATTKNVKWIAKLGSASYGNATVADGRVYVGTNNASPRDKKYQGDYGILMCLDEKTGNLLWQLAVPKLLSGKVNDWEEVGICSSPAVDGDHVYLVTSRCEAICLDVHGQAGGKNRGPFVDEAQYTAGPGKPPIAQGPTDADIIWRFDMREELGAFPHNQTSSSPLVVGDKVYITTSNGVDWTGKHIPAPHCPALICLDKNTGKLLAEEHSGISSRTRVCNWSSPAYGTIGGKPTIVFGAGDGYCYGFDPQTLNQVWRFDCNPPERYTKNGKPQKYGLPDGPSDVLSTPVVLNGRIYISIGQDPEQGDGSGAMNCFEPKDKTGDITQTAKIWSNPHIGRSVSTAAVADGLVYIAELSGLVHCLDAGDGHEYWNHDLESHVWGSTLLADGRIYVGNENGQVVILAAGKEKKVIGTIDLKDAIYSTPIAANGVLYVGTGVNLYALEGKK
ncbi:MAG TPA: PQQ-binding-like beta-propeller repeat protein [Tepidisphaeraceae bacterium]|jgi:outer membrane protein assembly factor BamB|nr:PQQ-binding-like beta-propeller repeat protein [Tepidisphaeraceae bacterium]